MSPSTRLLAEVQNARPRLASSCVLRSTHHVGLHKSDHHALRTPLRTGRALASGDAGRRRWARATAGNPSLAGAAPRPWAESSEAAAATGSSVVHAAARLQNVSPLVELFSPLHAHACAHPI